MFLISPFVGRIYDWYKKSTGKEYVGAEDPGVQSVTRIYNYYKANGYDTVVMGASFRNIGQIEQLAGCDRLTISPELLQQLSDDQSQLPRILKPGNAGEAKQHLSESQFRWAMNEDAMGTEKLAEGIRQFARDQEKLEALMAEKPDTHFGCPTGGRCRAFSARFHLRHLQTALPASAWAHTTENQSMPPNTALPLSLQAPSCAGWSLNAWQSGWSQRSRFAPRSFSMRHLSRQT